MKFFALVHYCIFKSKYYFITYVIGHALLQELLMQPEFVSLRHDGRFTRVDLQILDSSFNSISRRYVKSEGEEIRSTL